MSARIHKMNVFINAGDRPGADPMGLRGLVEPIPEPGRIEQDWAVVSGALVAGRKRHRLGWIGGLAAAASVALVVTLIALPRQQPGTVENPAEMVQAPTNDTASAAETVLATEPSTGALVAMSQDMEAQLRYLGNQVGSMPSDVVVYQVELQDLIGQVDEALSLEPDSRDLWSQRLALQMDLVKIYRGQLRRDHLRFASL